jgi:two-component system nitrate/nitrite response regulator NarL
VGEGKPATVLMILVFIVGTVQLHREGLALVLRSQDELRVVGTADPSEGAVLDAVATDVFVVDVASEGGISAVEALHRLDATASLVAVGVEDDESQVLALVEAGASGFVLADEDATALTETLVGAAHGETRCSGRMAAALAHRVTTLAAVQQRLPAGANLTARELEIVDLIDEGLSNKEIAAVLRIEVATVKNHVHNILEKLKVRRRGEAAAHVRAAFRGHRPERIRVLERPSSAGLMDPEVQRGRSDR